jgi:hypothetical protein
MKNQTALTMLIPLIFALALFAVGMGLLKQTPGQPYPFTSHRGETVMINGHGLYYYDTVSSAAQQQGNDVVTLFVALPMLIVSTWLAFRGSLRGRLLLTGIIGFFLYTYLSMSMLTAFNALFLVYVALFALSLYAFILCMMSFDLTTLPGHFSNKLPRGWIAALLFLIGAFLSISWLGRVLSPIIQNTPPLLDNTTTMVIQAMDLSLAATPASRFEIELGYMLSLGLFGLILVTVILFFTVWVIGIHYHGSPALILLIVAIMAVVGVILGILGSAFARTGFQVLQFIPLMIFPQVLLGGTFWPIADMSTYPQPFAYAMPIYYANVAL